MTVTKEQLKSALLMLTAIAEAIRELGQVPSGNLYGIVCMHHMDLGTYESLIDRLVGAKLVERRGNLLVWVGPVADDPKLLEAARLLGVYTAGRFDIWDLAGPAKSSCRQHVMTVLVNGKEGKNLPKSKCGVNALRTEFYKHVQPEGDCIATREQNFKQWCRARS